MSDLESIPINKVRRSYRRARRQFGSRDGLAQFLMGRGFAAGSNGDMKIAWAYLQEALSEAESDDLKAVCFLSLGQMCEQANDFGNAEIWYRKAHDLPPGVGHTWYFLHNNLAFCLNRAGRHEEAAELCRISIAIDPNRHNAFKNLGIALKGTESFAQAADAFRRAHEICPEDPRALVLLEQLRASHPEVG